VPKGFIPDTDNDNFSVSIEAAQGTSYYQMVKYQQWFVHRGAGSRRRNVLLVHRRQLRRPSGASGRMMVNTKPRRQRKAT
jgi:multidrug efflux pump subunit AcrB